MRTTRRLLGPALLFLGACTQTSSTSNVAGDGGDGGATSTGNPPAAGPGAGGATTPIDQGVAPMQSCGAGGAGMTDCGNGGESCCTSLLVTGGVFYRTFSHDGGAPTDETDTASVSSFRLDKYEVTVGRYRQFVAAAARGWVPAPGAGKHVHLNRGQGLAFGSAPNTYEKGWAAEDDAALGATDPACSPATWTPSAAQNERLPMNCVSWWRALAFCIWDGGFLPSEAEWEYASVGGAEQRLYPWGDAAPGSLNQYAIFDCHYPAGDATACDSLARIAPVGTPTSGAGKWGQVDLLGNIEEWNVDAAGNWINRAGFDAVPCTDCANLTTETAANAGARIARGSEFNDYPVHLSSTWRDWYGAASLQGWLGFRCARTP